MKHLGLLLLLITGLSAQAQTATPSPTPDNSDVPASPMAWFTAGPGFSSLTHQDSVVESVRTGLMLEADYEMPLTQRWSVDVGLSYIQKGENLDAITANPNNTGTISMNYFELPILARVNLPVYKTDKVTFFAGPYAAYAVSRSLSNSNNTNITSPVQSSSSLNNTRAYDVGVRLGGAFEIPVCDHWMATAGITYDLGLVNTNSGPGNSVQTRSLIAALGLGMKL